MRGLGREGERWQAVLCSSSSRRILTVSPVTVHSSANSVGQPSPQDWGSWALCGCANDLTGHAPPVRPTMPLTAGVLCPWSITLRAGLRPYHGHVPAWALHAVKQPPSLPAMASDMGPPFLTYANSPSTAIQRRCQCKSDQGALAELKAQEGQMRELVRLAEEREIRAKATMTRLLESRSSVLQGTADPSDEPPPGSAWPQAQACMGLQLCVWSFSSPLCQ